MNTKHKTINIKGVEIFYREAGESNKETILLLHGFPASSHMYRDIIELLSEHYHLIAPDYPSFGLSEAPSLDAYDYTFDSIAQTIEDFIAAKKISSFYLIMQDYGGPIGFRIATKNPKRIQGIIIQNANVYREGLGEWAQQIGVYQKANDMEGLSQFKNYLMSPEGIRDQYLPENGNNTKVDPSSYLTHSAFMQRIGINEKQTALFANYGTNFPKYPEWQQYLKEEQPPSLIVWGKHDKFFSEPGAHAYNQDLENASIHIFNSGHFMLEEYAFEVSDLIKNFIN